MEVYQNVFREVFSNLIVFVDQYDQLTGRELVPRLFSRTGIFPSHESSTTPIHIIN